MFGIYQGRYKHIQQLFCEVEDNQFEKSRQRKDKKEIANRFCFVTEQVLLATAGLCP
jgi:hypothetical protein